MWIAQRSSPYPSAAMNLLRRQRWGLNSIDGGGDQRQEVAGDEETIQRPRWQSELLRGRRVLEKVFQKISREYI